MPKVSSYKCYISRLIYPLSGNTLSKYKVPCHVKHGTPISIMILQLFIQLISFLYTNQTRLHGIICSVNLKAYFKKKEKRGSSYYHILKQSPQVVSAKEGKTKLKHIKSSSRTSKIITIRRDQPEDQLKDQPN